VLARAGQIAPAELANLIYAAAGESPRPSERAAAALDVRLERIPKAVAQRTLHDIAPKHAARRAGGERDRAVWVARATDSRLTVDTRARGLGGMLAVD
jgi:hypothetical protein